MRSMSDPNQRYGYGAIDKPKSVLVFAPDVTPEYRVRTRIDEKLSRLRELGTNGGDDEDTLLDLVGYLALLRGSWIGRGRHPQQCRGDPALVDPPRL